jgi:4-amino-4-deoxy-L-arabinose transferase-like glycosyltransferase
MSLKARLFSREVLPFYLALGALAVVTVLCDALLHYFNLVWIGRYLGIPGVLLILGSFGYSLRKRKLISAGRPVQLLRWHEGMAWAGSLLCWYAGIHFNAILGWLAVLAMYGTWPAATGKFLLDRAPPWRRARQRMRQQGLTAAELEDSTYWTA